MRIKVIIPNVGMSRETLNEREVMLKRFARPDTEISVDCISTGPESIESCYDEVLAGPEIVRRAVEAERQAFDAVVVYCFSDPAVEGARELVSVPVIGPGEASILSALALGQRFSIVTVLEETIPRNVAHAHRLGVPPWRLASVRSVGIPVSRLRDDLDQTYNMLLPVAKRCRDEDGAHVIVLAWVWQGWVNDCKMNWACQLSIRHSLQLRGQNGWQHWACATASAPTRAPRKSCGY
ncbi:MAG: aspartate/glutamate racemase family protein [Bacillota bacterium]